MPMKRILLVGSVLALVACGGAKWLESDANSTSNAMKAEQTIEVLCVDGGTCSPAQVRALDRMAWCSSQSILVHHGLLVLDAGGSVLGCPP
jgi:hypothetical protein